MINFKVGIIGAGNIAGKIADTLNKLDAFEPYAIASRDIEKANAFAKEYNIEKSYGSYEELVNDPEVELVYIATPHSHHMEPAKLAINAGKPVLVEKAFSYNVKTAEEVIKLAREKKVFAGEAMWIRFMPMYHMLFDYIFNHKAIGNVQSMTCSLGYDLRKIKRLTDPALAGGALLDLGVYPINMASMLFPNDPPHIASTCSKLETGVDAQSVIQFHFKSGKTASIFTTLMYEADNNLRIYGDKGYVELDNLNNPEAFRIYQANKQLVAEIKPPERQISGYEFQFIAARNAIINGEIEAKELPHAEILRTLHITDGLRNAWKCKFPMEDEA